MVLKHRVKKKKHVRAAFDLVLHVIPVNMKVSPNYGFAIIKFSFKLNDEE